MKNEGRYLNEFIAFHLGHQVEHFYLYDNNDVDDGTIEVCKKYEKVVTRIACPGKARQYEAFMDGLAKGKENTRWLAFLDIDEFLYPTQFVMLPSLLLLYERFPALCVHRYSFGNNGHETYTPIPVIERFTKRGDTVDPHIKSIVNPNLTEKWITAHKFLHLTPAVDENYTNIPDLESCPEPATANFIAINHYRIKSLEESKERRLRPRASNGEMLPMEGFYETYNKNEVEDLRALNRWLKIKEIYY